MEELFVTGPTALRGEADISGAKNSISKLLTASMLTCDPCTFSGVPQIGETDITCALCESMGSLHVAGSGQIETRTDRITSTIIPDELALRNRLSVMMLAPLLHRTGTATIHAAGGDRIGLRPVTFHLDAYRAMGAEVHVTENVYHVKATRLRGAHITLPYPSVTATENVLMAGSLAEGTTCLRNAAIEPEVLDLVEFLRKMGAVIHRRAHRTYVVEGVPRLHGATHRVMPDRLVAASLGAAAVATDGDVFVRGARPDHMRAFLRALTAAGARIDVGPDGIRFRRGGRLQAVAVETTVHPGFMTDWQPPMAVVLTQAEGISVVHETVFEDRFGYTRALNAMGASIELTDACLMGGACRFGLLGHTHSAIVRGPTSLSGAEIAVPDLRAGFTYLIAAVAADGSSRLLGAELIDRGYERIDEVLRDLGANIERRSGRRDATADQVAEVAEATP